MSYRSLAWVVVVLAGCGAEPGSERLPDSDSEADCVSCGRDGDATDVTAYSETPAIWATPDYLMFYGDASVAEAQDALPRQEVRVRNTTAQPALVSNIYITDNPYAVGGFGGHAHFSVELPAAQPTLAAYTGELVLDVRFLGSTQQRSAYLVVETNHPQFTSTVIGLTGKLFLGSDW